MSLYRFNANKSKKDLSRKSIGASDAKDSAYDRIFSKKNVISNTIPSFLIKDFSKEGLKNIDLLRFNLAPKSKPEKVMPELELNDSVNLKVTETQSDRLKINTEKLSDIKNIERIINFIFNPTFPPEEIILNFNKKKLTREDLLCFREGSDLPSTVVDCYMSILKISNNSVIAQKTPERIIVVNSQYSKMLFQVRKQIPKPKTDIFEYDILLFPIFDGYWRLMVVYLKTGLVYYYDALISNKEVNSMLVILRIFLSQANIKNDPKINENFISYQEVAYKPINMSLKDSGVYICKVAEGIAQKRDITQFNFLNMRKDMLNNLIKINLKIQRNSK
jgi:Ulp1 protease family, C-terminal catalytic domain